ncbi:MAG: hypothetical protein PF444_05015 [Bacteroidales bacterium]|nr:hypothetical protein [Bacteroidales bacterium]
MTTNMAVGIAAAQGAMERQLAERKRATRGSSFYALSKVSCP